MRKNESAVEAFYAEEPVARKRTFMFFNRDYDARRYFETTENLELLHRIDQLEEALALLSEQQKNLMRLDRFLQVPEPVAEEMILAYLRQQHAVGDALTPFDISQAISLPADQVEDILDRMVHQGRLEHNG